MRLLPLIYAVITFHYADAFSLTLQRDITATYLRRYCHEAPLALIISYWLMLMILIMPLRRRRRRRRRRRHRFAIRHATYALFR